MFIAHALIDHVHINTVDNINLADVANQFVARKDSRKQKFGHFSQNYICKDKLTSRYISFVYISYQIYEMWSCVTFYHSLNRFPQPNENCVILPENDLV